MLTLLFLPLLAPFGVLALPTPSCSGPSVGQSSPIQLIQQFPEIRLENLNARANGHLTLSVINHPAMYDLDPTKPGSEATLLYEFPDATALVGQAEIASDVFAVAAGNWTTPEIHAPGSFSVWSIDLNKPGKPAVKQIAVMPEANALNGMTALDGGSPDIVLIADSVLGALWRVNVTSGEYDKAIDSPLFLNTTNGALGINGLRSFQGSVYFTNSAQGTYGRVPVTYDGSLAGEVQIIATIGSPARLDDFDIDSEGNAWIATHPNSVIEVTAQGNVKNVTGEGGASIAQPSSARFGRGSNAQERTLYLATDGNQTAAGQVIAVNTCLV